MDLNRICQCGLSSCPFSMFILSMASSSPLTLLMVLFRSFMPAINRPPNLWIYRQTCHTPNAVANAKKVVRDPSNTRDSIITDPSFQRCSMSYKTPAPKKTLICDIDRSFNGKKRNLILILARPQQIVTPWSKCFASARHPTKLRLHRYLERAS